MPYIAPWFADGRWWRVSFRSLSLINSPNEHETEEYMTDKRSGTAVSPTDHIPNEHFVFDTEYARDNFFHNDDMIRVKQSVHNRYRSNPQTIIDHLLDSLALIGFESVLDLGCGNGFILREVALRLRAPGRAVGLDNAPGVLSEARRKVADLWTPVEFYERSADELDCFESDSFDRVMANYMMHYVPDIDHCLAEVRRIMTARGFFILTTDSTVSMHEMYRVHFEALEELDFPQRLFKATPKGRISLDDGDKILRDHFSVVEKRIYPDSLVFTSTQPFMDFYTIGHNYCCANSVAAEDLTAEMFGALYTAVESKVQEAIDSRGKFEVTKSTGSFLCWP